MKFIVSKYLSALFASVLLLLVVTSMLTVSEQQFYSNSIEEDFQD
ncbi:hypothetical protein [Wolbachia endosymbiont of Brugia pahangi]|nr:hypothetical protein [Wolbachia endosymbiont of Brugia pahangi]